MLQRVAGPLVAHQRVAVQFHQKPACVEAARFRELADRRRAANLPRVTIDEDAQPPLDRFGHRENIATMNAEKTRNACAANDAGKKLQL